MRNNKAQGSWGIFGFMAFIVIVLVFVFVLWPAIKPQPITSAQYEKTEAGTITKYSVNQGITMVSCTLETDRNSTYTLRGNDCLKVQNGNKLIIYYDEDNKIGLWGVE